MSHFEQVIIAFQVSLSRSCLSLSTQDDFDFQFMKRLTRRDSRAMSPDRETDEREREIYRRFRVERLGIFLQLDLYECQQGTGINQV